MSDDSAASVTKRPHSPPPAARHAVIEVLIVLGLSLGASAVYSVVSLLAAMTQGPLAQQSTTLNRPASPRPYLDLTYQLLGIGFDLVPVALALFLLGAGSYHLIGFDLRRKGRDLLAGLALTATVGLPGLGLYWLGRQLELNLQVKPSGLQQYWWTIPVLILSAARHAVVEEVIVVGYLLQRLPRCARFGPASAIALSAVLRGTYHLYQGFGGFVGNAAMGVLFAYYYRRTGRVMPLVIAHLLLDVIVFVGYALAGDRLGL